MRRISVLAIVLALGGVFPGVARAWNNAGHMTVALIAYRDLNDDGVRLRMAKLLENHPHFVLYLDKGRPEGIDRNEWIIARAATWPDFVRPKKSHPRPGIDEFHRGDDHFIDRPFVPPGDPSGIDVAKLQPKPPHALAALDRAVQMLRDKDAKAVDQAIALCWLFHLVGDVHQPLHAAKCYSEQFPAPQGDRGGNFFFVPNSRHAPNLHHYWDSLLGEDDHFDLVSATAEDLRRSNRLSRKALKAELKKTAFADWAEESYQAAVTVVYRNGKLRGINTNPDIHHSGGGGSDVTPLNGAYDSLAERTAQRRGVLAGYRLADQLKDLFQKAPR